MKIPQIQKRIKIAEFCGIIPCATSLMMNGNWREVANDLPDYFNDLNICVGFKKFLSGDQITDFINYLYFLTFVPEFDRDYGIVFAEAEHYCEAFGLTLKLWKGNE